MQAAAVLLSLWSYRAADASRSRRERRMARSRSKISSAWNTLKSIRPRGSSDGDCGNKRGDRERPRV